MSLNRCAHCTTLFAIGVEHCPQCGNADYYEEGSMPKISRHGGASYPVGVVPPGPELVAEQGPELLDVGPGTVVPDLAPESVAEEDDGPDDAPNGPYAGMLRKDLQDLCEARGLPTSGNKAELIARLVADNEARAGQDSEADGELGTVPVDPA